MTRDQLKALPLGTIIQVHHPSHPNNPNVGIRKPSPYDQTDGAGWDFSGGHGFMLDKHNKVLFKQNYVIKIIYTPKDTK